MSAVLLLNRVFSNCGASAFIKRIEKMLTFHFGALCDFLHQRWQLKKLSVTFQMINCWWAILSGKIFIVVLFRRVKSESVSSSTWPDKPPSWFSPGNRHLFINPHQLHQLLTWAGFKLSTWAKCTSFPVAGSVKHSSSKTQSNYSDWFQKDLQAND